MKQILQSLRTGVVEAPEVPCPARGHGEVLIRTRATLLSSGTERMLLEFGKANWIEKARQQPDKVRMVLQKVRTDGLAATLESVKAKLDEPVTLGYCNAGVVLEAGASSFAVGDRVVSNGPHAEIVSVPKNLCARIPEGVSDEAAAFTVLGAIALEGMRLAQPLLGECFAVTGLGPIGLIAVQLLRANGCRVLAIDLDARRLELARRWGAETVEIARGEDAVAAAERFSRGRGMDGVLIAAATKSSEPMHQAALMSRKRGRIVLVGVAGLELSRDDFYKKELSLQVSCSYGPGRYDPAYEREGQDYPVGYVRWTAQRNFEAVLDLMRDGRVDVAPLLTHRFAFERAAEAYELIGSEEFHLGVLLDFPVTTVDEELAAPTIRLRRDSGRAGARGIVGFIGAGGYACKILIPAFQRAGAELQIIGSQKGVSAASAARRFGFAEATTNIDALIEDERIDSVVIATQHDSHARLVCRARRAGKHVFVEKPLAMSEDELCEIESLGAPLGNGPLLMVGFNRRFAPHVTRMRKLLAGAKGPKAFVYTVNAGSVPSEHWTVDPTRGGGRIVGETCHFVDLLRFLAGAPIAKATQMSISRESMSVTLSFAEGSIGTIHYLVNGNRSFPKERLEVFCDGRILQLDNFRTLRGFGWPGFHRMGLWRQDKGAEVCAAAFLEAVREGREAPIPFGELIEVARTTLRIANER